MNGPKELCTANGFQQPTASSEAIQETPDDDNVPGDEKKHENDNVSILVRFVPLVIDHNPGYKS